MSESDLKQRLAAILAADVAGYSRLMAADERTTVAALDAARSVFKARIESNQGRIIDMAGDSVLAVFETAAGAVSAALAVQQQLKTLIADVPEDRHMRFRIGVHMGDVIEKFDGTIYGDGVNIAARLEGLAEPGGIAVSDAVRGAVKSRVAATFEDLGEKTVKNISEPVRVYAIHAGARTASERSRAPAASSAPAPAKRPSIAVLPFDNMSNDPEQEYFADGITEDVITELSKWEDFSVIARNSAFTYKGKAIKMQDLARDLGADFVLEGSVRKSGARIRITAQFIDAHSGHHVWADKFDETGDDLFDLQDRVTRKIVTTLGGDYGQIRKNEYERVWSQPASSLDEYDCFLRGHSVFYGFSAEAMKESRAIWSEGLARFPNSGLLKIKIAWTHIFDAIYSYTSDPVGALTQAFALCEAGMADKHLPQAGQRYGLWQQATLFLWFKRDHTGALRVAKSIRKLFPFDGEGLGMMAQIANYCGDLALAEEWMNESMARDPHVPEMALKNFGVVMYSLDRFDEAIEFLERTSLVDAEVLRYRAAALAAAGRLEEARSVATKLKEVVPGVSIAMLRQHIPYRNQEQRERELNHLRLAGLGEG
jgi:adenylate cyclase